MIKPETVPTDDGSHTLLHPVLGDTYHSTRGAVGESEHVFIRNGFDFIEKEDIRIFEMGFGSGLNALQTLRRAIETDKNVIYHTIELFPVAVDTIQKLNYISPEDPLYPSYQKMHESDWEKEIEINEHFRLIKNSISLVDIELDSIFDIIYFDAFAPETQPELWSEDIFNKLYLHTATGGILVTYSAKGAVKEALRKAGYVVKRQPGALGKRHMLRAQKL